MSSWMVLCCWIKVCSWAAFGFDALYWKTIPTFVPSKPLFSAENMWIQWKMDLNRSEKDVS